VNGIINLVYDRLRNQLNDWDNQLNDLKPKTNAVVAAKRFSKYVIDK